MLLYSTSFHLCMPTYIMQYSYLLCYVGMLLYSTSFHLRVLTYVVQYRYLLYLGRYIFV